MTTPTPRDLNDLAAAKRLLEDSSLAMRLALMAGKPVEFLLQKLPAPLAGAVNRITESALLRLLAVVARPCQGLIQSHGGLHKLMAMGVGAAGGMCGLPGLAVELPVSTGLMLSSIARIAECHGEDLRLPESRLQCLTVFALGGPSDQDDASQSAYFATRLALAKAVTEAADYLAGKGAVGMSAPALVRLVSAVGQRFGVAVSEKFTLQALPLLGAACGAGLNYAFMDHFQDKAQGHFTVRRLERSLGQEQVRELYARA